MSNANINYEQGRKINVLFEHVGGKRSLSILIDPETPLLNIMDILVKSKFYPNGDYRNYSFQNKRTNSFLSGTTLANSDVIDGDKVWVFPPLGAE